MGGAGTTPCSPILAEPSRSTVVDREPSSLRNVSRLAARFHLRILPDRIMRGHPGGLFGLDFARCLSEFSNRFSRMATMAPALIPEWKIVWNQDGNAL